MNDEDFYEFGDLGFNVQGFDSGDEEIDNWFKTQSHQYEKDKKCKIYVLLDKDSYLVGFFALAADSLRTKLGNDEVRWPAILIGQLGVHSAFQNKGYGAKLLKGALELAKAISEKIGVRLVVLHTYKKENLSFFEKFGFAQIKEEKIKDKPPRYLLSYDLKKDINLS